KRRDHVLERLLEEHFITQEQFKEAINQPIGAKYHGADIQVSAPYVAEMIRQSMFEHFGSKAYTKGYKVYTTIKGPLQLAANQAVSSNLLAYDKSHGYRGPLANIGTTLIQSPNALRKVLAKYPVIADLQPAVILAVDEKNATALLS